MIDQIEKQPPVSPPKPMILDMGLGSREQYFPLQKPTLRLFAVK